MKLYGIHPVMERIRSNPRSIRALFIEAGHSQSGMLRAKAAKAGVPVSVVPQTKIQKIARSLNHQGIVADVNDFVYAALDGLIDAAVRDKTVVVFLDGMNDPQNLGGIVRSLACLGRFCVVLSTHDCVAITETVMRGASGGENYVPVARVANISQAIVTAKDRGLWVAGSSVCGGKSLAQTQFVFPVGIVFGSPK